MYVTIKKKYIVYNHNGTGVRHHHFSNENIVHEFPDDFASVNELGNRTASAPSKYTFGQGPDLDFAFMSVTGTKDGNFLYTTAGDYKYYVGSQDINILAVYAPAGGSGNPTIWVDAFNANTGAFSDDVNFISVLTPPQNSVDIAKTFEANQEGDISPDTAENIKASGTIDNGVPFIKWKQIIPVQNVVVSPDFSLPPSNSSKIWIAFYQSPNQLGQHHIPDHILLLYRWVDYATMVDGHGGPGDPEVRLASEVRQFAMGVALAKTAGDFNSNLRRELLDVAIKQIEISSQAIQKKIGESIKG